MKLITSICIAMITVTPFCAAHATPGDAAEQTVRFADLDLTKEAGMAALYQRIRGAAQRVCDHAGEVGFGIEAPRVQLKCARQAISTAVERIGRPEFIAYVAARTGAQVAAQMAAR